MMWMNIDAGWATSLIETYKEALADFWIPSYMIFNKTDTSIMKKIVIISFLCGFFIPVTLSQNVENDGDFLKRIEYNLIEKGGFEFNEFTTCDVYNLNSKGYKEKLLFGNFNAPVEIFFGEAGFRVVRDSLDTSYILEIKRISNYEEASEETREKRHLIDVPVEVLNELPRDAFNLIYDYNSNIAINKRYFEELPKHLKVETLSLAISDRFAERLYGKMVSFIDNFKARGVPPSRTCIDCSSVTFRTVVEDEVWSLWIYEPQGNALKMSNLCRQIMTDVETNTLDESKYAGLLDEFLQTKETVHEQIAK
jgi:hypothetical protein